MVYEIFDETIRIKNETVESRIGSKSHWVKHHRKDFEFEYEISYIAKDNLNKQSQY
jgi:hypothetical protein